MFEIIVVLFFLLILAIAAMYWGYDSRDGLNSAEWKRRNQYSWFFRRPDDVCEASEKER